MQGILSHFKWIKTYNKNEQVLGCSLADQLFLKWVYLYACTLIKC